MQSFVARHRIGLSRAYFVLIIGIILFTTHRWADPGLFTVTSGALGFVGITVAALGRLWSSVYICGYKNRRVIQDGPYSVVRNPLYVFSLIGGIGIGLITHSLLVTGLIVLFFIWIYPLTVADEEARLERLLGEEYVAYKAQTPRFVPALKQFNNAEQYTINIPQMQSAFMDALWFFLGYGMLQGIALMHDAGWLAVLVRVP